MADQPRETTVAQQENNGFGPLFKPRGRAATIASLVVVIVSGVVLVFSVRERESKEGIHFLVFASALLTLSVVIGELVRKMCLVFEEIRHKETRYQRSWKHVFNSAFPFEYGRSIIIVTVGSALVCYALHEHCEAFAHPDYVILFSLNCFLVPPLLFLVGLRELSPAETSQINEKENKNVADGLAWSYYFGYLKFMLPRLEDQIAKSTKFRFEIKKKKLFILLPKNCATPSEITHSDPRVTMAETSIADALDPLEKNRGGIKKRSYKHTVHRIVIPRPDGKVTEDNEYYCVVEYATPLLTLYEMSQNPGAGLSRQERDHQVVLFTRKLKEILDGCKDCKDKYVLVPFSGEDGIIADVLVQMHKDSNLQLDDSSHAGKEE